jgi:hypothetical protein
VMAGISAVSSIPVAGDLLAAGKMAFKYGDDVVGVAGVVAKHGDEIMGGVGAVAKTGDDLVRGGIKWVDDTVGAACSFTPTTLVATPTGNVPIGELEVGDLVTARDEATGETSTRAVEAVLIHEDAITGTVVIDGQNVETTPEHPFFSLDRGFVPAAELRVGELVASEAGDPGRVDAVAWNGGPQRMWNLTVATDHTFFVGTGGWWVHNACKLPDELAEGANAQTGVSVYLGENGGQNVNVGITNDIARRGAQHGERFRLSPIADDLTRGQARAVEQALIERNPGFQNVRNSIGPRHKWQGQAVDWGNEWLRANGY